MATQNFFADPDKINPQEPIVTTTYIVAGNVIDLLTAKYGINLQIVLCKVSNDNLSVMKSCNTDENGGYSIVLTDNDLKDLPVDTSLELLVYKGKGILELAQKATFILGHLKERKSILIDLQVYTKPIVYGRLQRKEGIGAASCLVKVYIGDFLAGQSKTDLDGNYVIPYNIPQDYNTEIAAKNGYGIKVEYYNNEDISSVESSEKITILTGSEPSNEFTKRSLEDIDKIGSIQYEIAEQTDDMRVNDIVIEKLNGRVLYYQVMLVNEHKLLRLVYIKDETGLDKNYYRVFDETRIEIEKKLKFEDDKKIEYTRIPSNEDGVELPITDPRVKSVSASIVISNKLDDTDIYLKKRSGNSLIIGSKLSYLKETFYYQKSYSPKLYKASEEIKINFRFTKSTIDLYTQIANRAAETQALQSFEHKIQS